MEHTGQFDPSRTDHRYRLLHAAGEAFAHAAPTAIPMQRQGTPKECADLVLFLAADESSFISGAEIAIDGGYIAAGLAGLRNRLREDFAAGRN
jgi:3alpha(or 20beta)-hydroxysteroid dehydrogenase